MTIPMTKTQARHYEILKRLGWQWYGTGGGCDAYMLGDMDTQYALITDESNIPRKASDKVTIGFYRMIEDEDTPIATITCKLSDVLTGKITVEVYKV